MNETKTWQRMARPELLPIPEVMGLYSLTLAGSYYSPDLTWLIAGKGAAERLTDYLNALEAEVAWLRAPLEAVASDPIEE